MLKELDWKSRYLVAVSGGPDSIFLLTRIVAHEKFKSENFVICHVNYNYRSDSIKDQKIVEQLCHKYNLRLEVMNLQKDYKNLKENFEDFARNVRYNFFIDCAQKFNIWNLLVAHNLNDVIETYLLQKIRNNIVETYGIAKISHYQNLKIIRPLLEKTKSSILKTLDSENIAYAIDSTNFDEKFLRNKIRKNLEESEFQSYSREIKLANIEMKKMQVKRDRFLKENQSENILKINQLDKQSDFSQKMIIAKFILESPFKDVLVFSKKKLLSEIQKICISTKPFILIKTKDNIIMKDFNELKLIKKTEIQTKTNLVNSAKELGEFIDLGEEFLITQINFPVWISNDYNKFKTNPRFNNKTLSKIYSGRKKNYFDRLKIFFILDYEQKSILYIF
ncbi:tRNA(Ile)-lysidine synthase [Spiroplasma sabaudiense Ar-1343]|uniref:tRNA(Ile)-lysidine synthase n=1 Tax=Spiroplasma sabaudiense Ar-1343 TaxID=1276257 RepID=W6AI89_9MOLU|nr:tRNA lysidine(34) synthetase TilS [Spiroplasma sabaudiense]AHI53424.1 tRNA(Ile)-lysidine synthase [Spiroplasma sabaudiense Ar-1343]